MPRSPRARSTSRRRQLDAPSPSSSLLSIIATVAASSSTVDGRPLPTQTSPPEFLCPQLGALVNPTPAPFVYARDSDDSQGSSASSSSSQPSSAASVAAKSVSVADKYVSYDDGRWRKTDVWTLYGSTFCQGVGCSSVPTATSTVILEESGSMTITLTPSATVSVQDTSASGVSEDVDVLPSGWTKAAVHEDRLTPVIIVLSVVLALSICGFIITCVFWRRRRMKRLKDPEKYLRRNHTAIVPGGEEAEELKRIRTQQKFWAKASAKWRSNVRQSARRRRKRGGAAKDVDVRSLAEPLSISSATSLHRLHTITSMSQSSADIGISSETDAQAEGEVPPHQDFASIIRHPPAYLSMSSGASVGDTRRIEDPPLSPFADPHELEEHIEKATALAVDEGPLPYSDPFNVTGHIATDDKAMLARITELASAPPLTDRSTPDDNGGPSVPPLEDDFEAVPFDLHVLDCAEGDNAELSGSWTSPYPRSPSIAVAYPRDVLPHPILPSPPSKSRMLVPTFYEYPASFEEDVLNIEPEAGPSAPPFDPDTCPSPSAPPPDEDFDEDSIPTPSAPPLEEEEEPGVDETPSAAGVLASIEESFPIPRTFSHIPAPPRYLP